MLSIVLPCYNEAENIPLLFEVFKTCIGNRKDVEVLFVNNGSTDNSNEVLNSLLHSVNLPVFRKVNIEVNHGYGFGVLAGLKEAKGDVLAWTHADLQTNPTDVLIAYDKFNEINNKFLFVKGKRYGRRFHAWIFSYIMQVLSSWVLNQSLDDINAQPKVFSRDFYESYIKDKAPFDFSLDLFVCYYASQVCKILEIPVVVDMRQFGFAKGGGSVRTKLKLIQRTLKYIIKLRSIIKG